MTIYARETISRYWQCRMPSYQFWNDAAYGASTARPTCPSARCRRTPASVWHPVSGCSSFVETLGCRWHRRCFG